MQTSPFKRARAMMQAIAAIFRTLPQSQAEMSVRNMKPYRSRGKGRGKAFTKTRGNHSYNFKTPHQSFRERARRVRQLHAGILNGVQSKRRVYK